MILIRKECQAILDDAGLGQFHVQMGTPRWSGDEAYLEIVTECGKPLVKVKGIPIKKTRYTPAEREYTVELFGEFMLKYLPEITEYLLLKKVLKMKDTRVERLKKQEYRGDLPIIYVKGKIKREILGISYDEGPFYVTVFKGVANPRVLMHMHVPTCKSLVDLSKQNGEILRQVRQYKLDPKRLAIARADVILYDKEIEEHTAAETRIKEIEEVFESCTI